MSALGINRLPTRSTKRPERRALLEACSAPGPVIAAQDDERTKSDGPGWQERINDALQRATGLYPASSMPTGLGAMAMARCVSTEGRKSEGIRVLVDHPAICKNMP